MKKKLFKSLSIALVMAAILPTTVLAETTSEKFAGNILSAGNSTEVKKEDAQDIFAAAQNLSIDKSVAQGNIFAAGQILGISDTRVGADIFAAGQSISIEDTSAYGAMFIAGQDVTFSSTVSKSIVATGNNLIFEGAIEEGVLSGDKVEFNGYAKGDVHIEANEVIIGENAVVEGTLNVKAPLSPEIPAKAQIGDLAYEVLTQEPSDTSVKVDIAGAIIKKITSGLYWMVAMIIVGLVLCLLFGKHLDEANEVIAKNPVEYILFGALGWLFTPIVLIAIAFTGIGAPLAAIFGLLYVGLIWIGVAFAGASLGRLVLKKINPVLASVIGIAILELVKIVPVIGAIIAILADMYVIGYVYMQIKNAAVNGRAKKAVKAEALENPPVFAKALDAPVESADENKEN